MPQSKFRILIFIISTFICSNFILNGCHIQNNNSDISIHPKWISETNFKEFPEPEFLHAIGVSDSSYEHARQKARAELKNKIITVIQSYVKKQPKQAQSQSDSISSEIKDKFDSNVHLFSNILLENDKQIHKSWAEMATQEKKKYSDGFTFYSLVTISTKKVADFYFNKNFYPIDHSDKKLKTIEKIFMEDVIKYVNTLHKTQAYLFLHGLKVQDSTKFALLNIEIPLTPEIVSKFYRLEKQIRDDFQKVKLILTNNYQCGKISKYLNDMQLKIFWGENAIKLPIFLEFADNQATIEMLQILDAKFYKIRLMPLKLINSTGLEEIKIKIDLRKFRLHGSMTSDLEITARYFVSSKNNSIVSIQSFPKFPKDELSKPSIALNSIASSNVSDKIMKFLSDDGYITDYWSNQNSNKLKKFVFSYHLKIIVNEFRIISSSNKSLASVSGDLVLYQLPSQAVKTGIRKIIKEKETTFKFTDVFDKNIDNQKAMSIFSNSLVQDKEFQKKLLRMLSIISKVQAN